ncbi:MAG TPA: ribbon-helix-helix protein, CopG family [Clostridia bacterium]|nr:ribbon-helix-helix protein, CopG family [Clostridia bacterium]
MNQGIEKIGELLTPAEEEVIRLRAELQEVYRQQEKKSERIQLLIRPSMKADLDKLAAREGVSRNEVIGQLLEEAMEARG